MIPVFQHAPGGSYHWADTRRPYLASHCGAWQLRRTTATDPVSVLMTQRCTHRGCAVRWDAWLRRTIHDALIGDTTSGAAA